MEILLTCTIFLPVIFVLIALGIPSSRDDSTVKGVCTAGAFLTFLASLPLVYNYNSEEVTLRHEMLAVESRELKPLADDERHFVELMAASLVGHVSDGDFNEWETPTLEALQEKARRWDLGDRSDSLEETVRAGKPSVAALAFMGADGTIKTFWKVVEVRKAAKIDLAKRLKYVSFSPWIPTFNINYFVGLDGLSVPLVFLTTLLTFLCLVYSWSVDKGAKGFYILFLILETGLVGVFSSLDLFLFYVFWEIVLLPSYFLIGIWGGPKRNYAAIKFFLYTLAGSVLLLLAMLALYFSNDPHSFNMLALLHDVPNSSLAFQTWIFIGMFIAFAIKVPVFPFHTWLPDAHVQAPTAFSVMLAGVMLKMGAYGFFRLAWPMCPDALAADWSFFGLFSFTCYTGVAVLGLVNIIYGAMVAMAQKDFKSLVAYSSVSHMGYILLGLGAFTHAAFEGAALQMFNHGVSSAMLFFLVGVLYDRAHHRDLDRFGGIGLQMPWYTGLAIIGFFSALGLPGLNGFISEALVFLGAYQSTFLAKWIVFVAVIGIVLGAAYLLWTIRRVYLGDITNESYKEFSDLQLRETVALVPLAVICVVLGVYPKLIIDIMDATMVTLLEMSSAGLAG